MSEDPPDFETALKRIEKIVASLERGDLDLTGSLAAYEEGVKLLGRCHALLDSAEKKVALLTGLNEEGSPITTPFDAGPTPTTATRLPPQGPSSVD